MVISRRFYGVLGVAAIGSFIYFANALALPVPKISSQNGNEATVNAKPQESTTEARALSFHTKGIRKALNGDYFNAIVDYDQALMLSPHNPEIYYNRAVAHYSVGKSKLALQDWDRAIQLQPTMAEAYANRSILRLETGDRAGAFADGRKAADLFKQQGELTLSAEIQDWVQQQTTQRPLK
jgi:Flp pilus assembly protein TadD